MVYIGETGRSLETRKGEHIDAVKNFDLKQSAPVLPHRSISRTSKFIRNYIEFWSKHQAQIRQQFVKKGPKKLRKLLYLVTSFVAKNYYSYFLNCLIMTLQITVSYL